MKMKLTHYIFSAMTALAALTACQNEVIAPDAPPTYTVGEAINAITLSAGISEGSEGVLTRAVDGNHAGKANGGAHTNLTEGTKLTLRVDGTWVGKADGEAPHGTITSQTVSQKTTATIGEKTGTDDLHNKVIFGDDEKLYWDDYGTADPANTGDSDKGREKGLTIYGVAVDGFQTAVTVDGTSGKQWNALSWQLAENQSADGVWGTQDLLISNNIRIAPGDGTYTFDDYVHDLTQTPKSSSNLLEFTHAMSKVTVKLIAGEGFSTEGVGATDKKFKEAPEVLLTSNLYNETSNNEWAYTQGSVNVETGVVSSPSETKTITTMTTKTDDSEFTVVKEALVMPGSIFGDNSSGSYPQVLSILADGNRYYVTSEKMYEAISAAITAGNHVDSYATQPGKNYIFKIMVNKTGINVTATIKNWLDVEAESVSPVINVNASYGGTETGGNTSFTSFSFYRSLKLNNEYSQDYSGNQNSYYAAEGTPTGTLGSVEAWTFASKLYWSDHNTHYFFRGVWPLTSVNNDDLNTAPHVKDNTGNSKQVIDVKNVAYTQYSYPSDLAIGMPNFTDENKMCQSHSNHTPVDQSVYGICATTGTIALNFKYVMSQVEVELRSVTGTSAVNIDENTVVELVNVYSTGEAALADRKVEPTGITGVYRLDNVTGDEKKLFRHSAIVPQILTYTEAGASGNVRFKITVTNDDAVQYADVSEYNAAKGTSLNDSEFSALTKDQRTKTPATTDVYYADVNPIKKNGSSDPVALNGKWESGVHYKYVLTLSKTEIMATATITDWVTVAATENVWF